MTIIPAIDIIGGRCVRLSQGDYDRCTTYPGDPLNVALRFADAGFTRLHVVDLEGAKTGGVVNIRTLEKICAGTPLSVDFGGGVKSAADLRRVFDAGADYACIGSVAATDPAQTEQWLDTHGRERIIISADTLGGTLRTNGWREASPMTVFDLIHSFGTKMKYLMCTDISRDGMFTGPATELYRTIAEKYPFLSVIASGGVGSAADLAELAGSGVSGAVVGKAIYEGRITLGELKTFDRCSQNV